MTPCSLGDEYEGLSLFEDNVGGSEGNGGLSTNEDVSLAINAENRSPT